MHHEKAEINRVFSQRQHIFMSTNKMAEIADSEAAPVDTFIPEVRLDDNDRRKLVACYNFVGQVPKIVEESSKRKKETALKDLQEHFEFNYTSDELVGVWKSAQSDHQTSLCPCENIARKQVHPRLLIP